MKTTGITRRIDELGRIVIPKEIRYNMHIKPGELLEIFLSDENTISLKKHNILNNNSNILSEYIDFLAKKMNSNVFLADLDKVIFSNKLSQKNEPLISKIDSNISGLDKIELTNNYTIKQPFSIYNLNPNGDLIGHLILEHNNIQNDQLTEFAVEFIIKYLETD